MKQIIFCLLLCYSCGLFAQNWTAFPYNQQSWFEFENETHYSQSVYYADSLVENGDTNNYYFHLKYLDNLLNSYDPLYDIGLSCLNEMYNDSTTWLEHIDNQTEDFVSIQEPLQEINGQYYFKGNLVFDATLQVGESIAITSNAYVGFDEVRITCTNQMMMNIYGNMDNVKTFSLQAFSGGVAIDSDFDNHTYILSQNYGFTQFLPFNELLNLNASTPKTTVKLLGFENDDGEIQGKKAWTIYDFIPYEVGDVLYYVKSFTVDDGESNESYIIDSITSVNIVGDALQYTCHTISSINGNVGAIEYTRNIDISFVKDKILDKGIYNIDLQYDNQIRLFPIDVAVSQNDFSFVEGEPSYDVSIERDRTFINDDCVLHGDEDVIGATYNTVLGKTYDILIEEFEVHRWKLLLYKKRGNQLYNSLIVPLENTYACTDDSIILQNLNNGVTYLGVGVEGNVFYPSLVPESLYNIPLEITYFLEEDECYCNATPDSLILSETIIIECAVEGDCALSNFTAISSGCNAYGGINIAIDFDFGSVGTEGFAIMFNDEEYGVYSYQTLYENGVINIPLVADNNTAFDIFVMDKENNDCRTNAITIELTDCTDDICIFSNIAATTLWDDNDDYIVNLSFDYQGLTSESFAVYRNSFFKGYFSYEEMNQNGFIALPQSLLEIYYGTMYEIEVVDSLWTDCVGSINVGVGKFDVDLYAFLEGAYNSTAQNMNSLLAQEDLLPLTQPYNVPPWNYNGTESIEEFLDIVVDWVLIEVRSGVPSLGGTSTTTVVETQAGLLLTNGRIVNTQGQSLRFENLVTGESYYIALRHRNHLDVLSAMPITANQENMSYDFRTNPAFGANQQKVAADGNYVLYGGDYIPDGVIQNSDNDAWKAAPAILNTYTITDGTLDGIVQLTDQDVWLPNKAKIGVVEIRY